MASELQARVPHPPTLARQQSNRFRLPERGNGDLHGRVPVALDEFTYLVGNSGSAGLDECMSKVIDAVTNELYQNQQEMRQQKQLLHQQNHLPHHSFSAQQSSPQGTKQNQNTSVSPSTPRRSPARAHVAQSAPAKDVALPSDEPRSCCVFCEAAQADHETKQRRERCRIITMNPVTGNELSPGGSLPMRDAVATCARCNGGVCEAHLMLHCVKMPSHWDAMTFYDGAVDSAYRSLPPQAQLLSRVMLSVETIRKRSTEQSGQSLSLFNPNGKSRDVYRRNADWEGQHFQSYEISSLLARCASVTPPGPKAQGDESLAFESRFESGNLARAERIGASEYVLYLREDMNLDPVGGRDKCYNQWFFFRVDGMQQQRSYTFHICNMYKAKSLFQCGMHVLLRSPESHDWFRGGSSYMYKESTFMKKGAKPMYQLSFKLCGQHASLYVAAAQPYTYTHLCTSLDKWLDHSDRAIFMKRSTLCKTLAGNVVDVLTITDPQADSSHVTPSFSQFCGPQLSGTQSNSQRPWVVVCGRVHPSESNASWFVHGLIEFLSDPKNAVAEQLRRQFVWLVVPMMNPDGVICGNSRCNLAGLDLNRCWDNPSESSCPTVFHTKALLHRLCPLVTISLFLDVHGHSRKRGAFFYGNRKQLRSVTGQALPFASAPVGPEVKVPQLFAAHSSVFSLHDCSYMMSRSKLSTARCVMFNEFMLVNSFTLEISMFASASLGDAPSSHVALLEPDLSTRPLTFRDVVERVSEVSGAVKSTLLCPIPQHLEKDDFMKLSRDFATCLIATDLSWMVDSSGIIMKMSSALSSGSHATNAGDENPDVGCTAVWTPECNHAVQWLFSRGINISIEKDPQVDSRLLVECKSIRASVQSSRALPSMPINPSCAKIMKLLLGSARAHHVLEGEESNTRSSVQSFIQHQLRLQVKQTDAVQVQATLRALADWMDFVIKFNGQQQPACGLFEANIECIPQTLPEHASAVDVASLAAVQRRINDALQRLQHLKAGDTVVGRTLSPKEAESGDEQPMEHRNVKINTGRMKSQQSVYTSSPRSPHKSVFDEQASNVQDDPSLQASASSSSSTYLAASKTPQQCDSFVKPWSLSIALPDGCQSPARPASNVALAHFDAAQLSGSFPFGSRMRQRILMRKGGSIGVGRIDAADNIRKESACAAASNTLHVVSLAAPSASAPPSSQLPVYPPILPSLRRVRIAGALPFPLQQQHQSAPFQKQSAAATDLQYQQNHRSHGHSVFSTRSHAPLDAVAAGGPRLIEFSIHAGAVGSVENLWSVPSVGGGFGDADSRKSKGTLGMCDVLVLKTPTVTTVQPFENVKPLPQQQSKRGLRPSTYR